MSGCSKRAPQVASFYFLLISCVALHHLFISFPAPSGIHGLWPLHPCPVCPPHFLAPSLPLSFTLLLPSQEFNELESYSLVPVVSVSIAIPFILLYPPTLNPPISLSLLSFPLCRNSMSWSTIPSSQALTPLSSDSTFGATPQ